MMKCRIIAIAVACLAISILWTGGAELHADDNPIPIPGCEVIGYYFEQTQATVDCSEFDGDGDPEPSEGWECSPNGHKRYGCEFTADDQDSGEADDDQNQEENLANVEITVNSCETKPIVGLEDKEYASITVTGNEEVLINTVDTGGFALKAEVDGESLFEQEFPIAWTLEEDSKQESESCEEDDREEDSVGSLTLYFDLSEISVDENGGITVTLNGETLEQELFSGTAEMENITNLVCEESDGAD
jgi:hypothetical protein